MNTEKTDYDYGYSAGFRDGKTDGEGVEQDFAYKSGQYERGYWKGFKDSKTMVRT